jgi:predicted Zn-dependent protease
MLKRLSLCALLLPACIRNPATGKLQLDLVSRDQEVQMGQQGKQEVEQTIGLYKDPKLEPYVAELGKLLAPLAGEPNFKFSYEIVDDAAVNAFALPGGPIFVTRGLLGHLASEAQLVAVMGHETGHVAAHHSANQMSKAQLAQIGLGVGSIISPTLGSLSQVAGAGLQLLFLKYSRDDETQADELGFRFMTKAGYDPRQMLDLFDMLDGVSKQAGGGKTPQWLETHPDPGNRHAATEERLKTELKGDPSTLKVEREKYLQLLDGLVFGEDPRQGYFKSDVFYHPALKFQMTFPSGWQHQNTSQAVVAVSPKQDAMLQLAVAGKMTPQEAAQKFFAQQGVKQGQAAAGAIRGGASVSAYFQAQTQQGVVDGLVTFLSHDGTTYVIYGYTPQNGLPAYDKTFRDAMGSFQTLSDSGALSVQPAKLKIVRLDAPMTLAEFNSKYPSSVKPELVALINGVGSGEKIRAGYAKQVVGGTTEK